MARFEQLSCDDYDDDDDDDDDLQALQDGSRCD